MKYAMFAVLVRAFMHLRRSSRSRPTATSSYAVAVLSLLLAVSACAGRRIPATTVLPRPLGRDVPVYQPSPGKTELPPGSTFEHPADTVSLRAAVALALLHSPDLAAFAWETRAREARIVQAGRPPNPDIGALAEDLGSSTLSSNGVPNPQVVQPQTTIQLSQLIELGGKRTARQNFAGLNRDLAAWDYEAARIDVLTQVTRAFIDVLAAQAMVALTSQTAELVAQVQQSVAARVVAGVVSPIEETRADVALAAARVESDRAVRLLDAKRGRLAAHWGASEARFRWAAGDLTAVPGVPLISVLRSHLTENPDLARWAVEISQRQAALAVERSKRVPDVTLTAGYRHFTEVRSSAYLIGASLALPLFDRNSGGTEEARSRVAKAHEERRAVEAHLSAALSEAYGALSSALEEVKALRDTILPRSQETFELVSEGYRLGKFGYLDVLDAQRTLISMRSQFLRAVSDYHKAVADVERLIGAPLNGIPNSPR